MVIVVLAELPPLYHYRECVRQLVTCMHEEDNIAASPPLPPPPHPLVVQYSNLQTALWFSCTTAGPSYYTHFLATLLDDT